MSDDLNTPWYVFPLSRNHASVMNNNGLPIIDKMDTEKATALVRVVNSHDLLISALTSARNRLRDMLYQDDGQSYKESERAMPEIEDVMTRFSRINQEMENAGLLHDKAHVDTGKVRAAQSVRTQEMSYRPGSLPMEGEPFRKLSHEDIDRLADAHLKYQEEDSEVSGVYEFVEAIIDAARKA